MKLVYQSPQFSI
jgi:hypothetical protein